MRSDLRLAATLTLALGGCGGDTYAAAVHLTLTGATAAAGGGYLIDVREPDGEPIAGLSPHFVSTTAGTQDVTLVFENAAIFGGRATRDVRLAVTAAASASAPPAALASKLVVLAQGKVIDVGLELRAAPPAPAQAPEARFVLDRAHAKLQLVVNVPAFSPRAGTSVHLWRVAGAAAPAWLGLAPTGGGRLTIDLAAGDLVATTAVTATEEADDSPTPLAVSSGWAWLTGGVPATARPVLGLLIPPGGAIDQLFGLLDTATSHSALAATSLGAQLTPDGLMHLEHTYNALAGAARASPDLDTNGKEDGDLNGDGALDWATSDQAGITGPAGGAAGHLDTIRTMGGNVAELRGAPISATFAQLTACANRLDAGLTAVLADLSLRASQASGGTLADPTLATTIAGINGLTGAVYDGSSAATQTALCVEDRVEALSTLTLAAGGMGSEP